MASTKGKLDFPSCSPEPRGITAIRARAAFRCRGNLLGASHSALFPAPSQSVASARSSLSFRCAVARAEMVSQIAL